MAKTIQEVKKKWRGCKRKSTMLDKWQEVKILGNK